jgi:enoyl-[acyl-carrier protein] reductase II
MTRLQQLMARGTDFLGTDVAIISGAMSWISERHLVSAMSNAGGFGVIACGAMPPDILDAEIKATQAMTGKPFGVNLITMHPQVFELIDVCARNKVTHVVLAGGLPPAGAIDAIKAFGAKLLCFAPALSLAKKLIRSGVDAIVIVWRRAAISAPFRHRSLSRKSCPRLPIRCLSSWPVASDAGR